MGTSTSEIEVQFNPAPAFFIDYLTADIGSAECVFDLIDNSIDAARSDIEIDKGGLPSSYANFRIELSISAEHVSVVDNCSGISESDFSELTFRSGSKSHHAYGIGHFGVGLKRAILKLGRECKISTDDGISNIAMDFTRDQLDASNDLKLSAFKEETSGSSFTEIHISDLSEDTKRDLGSIRWVETLLTNIGRRYGLFIRKGLSLVVNGEAVKPFAPQPVESDYIPIQNQHFEAHGVEVEIVAGVHERYRFAKNEDGTIGADQSNLKVHREIASDFGWYVVCNDRVIVLSDKTEKTGWTQNWHNEYSGFVGWLHFRSEDPSLLPWDTKKSNIVENSQVYSDVLEKLRSIATEYRRVTPLARRKGESARQHKAKKPKAKTDPVSVEKIRAGTATKKQLSSIETLLPTDIGFASKKPRLAGLVRECEQLHIGTSPYASAVMLRVVFEAALKDYIQRQKRFTEMRDSIFDASLAAGQTTTAKQRKNFSPPMSDILAWCHNNVDVFPDAHVRPCRISCERFSYHLTTLNGVIHEEGGIIDASKVKIMRDEVLQGLIHFLSI